MTEPARIVAIDANALILACTPSDELDYRRLEYLLKQVDKAKGRLIVPTPAIAEFLVKAETAALATMDELRGKSSIVIAAFDLLSAHELAQMDAAALGRGNKRDGMDREWQRIKIDRQVVAIAKRHGAELIVTGDDGVRAAAARVGIRAVRVSDLPFPDSARQALLPIAPPALEPATDPSQPES